MSRSLYCAEALGGQNYTREDLGLGLKPGKNSLTLIYIPENILWIDVVK